MKKRNPRTKQKSVPKWQKFEDLVTEIQRELSPEALVTPNDKIKGKSGIERQIDISVRAKVGEFELLMVIDCKDYNSRVDIKTVEEVKGLAEDVRANKAAVVSFKGFTDGAKKRAQEAGIDLYRLIDTSDHPWQAKILIPSICEVTIIKAYRIKFENNSPGPFEMNTDVDLRNLEIFNKDQQLIGRIQDLIHQKWSTGDFPFENDTLDDFEFADNPVFVNNNNYGVFFPINIKADLKLETKRFLGQVSLTQARGLHNDITGRSNIVSNLQTESVELDEIRKSWKLITNIDDIAIKPMVIFRTVKLPSKDRDS